MQEPPPSYIPPPWMWGENPSYYLNAAGQYVDISSEIGATIGQLAQSEYPPLHGWMLGEGNAAIPVYRIPGQPSPAEIMAMLNSGVSQYDKNAGFLAALLLL